MNEIKIFENKDFGKIEAIELNGEWRFELYSIGMALGQVKESKGNFYPRKERIDENVKNAGIKPVVHDGQLWITEPEMYDLMFETHTERVKPFKKWVTSEVLPTIRRTGGYIGNDELFIATYLPYADEETKVLFRTTLLTVRKQNETIKKQREEIEHKEDVIIGLVDDITLAEKRQILNRVVRYNHANYRNRWAILYREFENKYHIDLQKRMDRYNSENKPKCKNKLDYIDRVMGKIRELYEIAAKLFEADVKALIEEMYQAVATE